MKITYDAQVDDLRIQFSNAAVEESDDEKPGISLDFDISGNMVGMEILDAAKRMENPRAVEWERDRILPMLAGLQELVPRLKRWHDGKDPAYGIGRGDFFAGYVMEEARLLWKTVEDLIPSNPSIRKWASDWADSEVKTVWPIFLTIDNTGDTPSRSCAEENPFSWTMCP